MNRQHKELIKRALLEHGIDVTNFSLENANLIIDDGPIFVNEHTQVNGVGNSLVPETIITHGNVKSINGNMRPPLKCQYGPNKTILRNIPPDEERIEYSTEGEPTLTSYTGDKMISFTTNIEMIEKFRNVAHPMNVFNIQVNNQNNIVVYMNNEKKVEVLTMVRALGDELKNFMATESEYFIFDGYWRRVGVKEICRKLHYLCETRLVITKEMKTFLGSFHRGEFQASIDCECFNTVDKTLSMDVFPMLTKKVVGGKILPMARNDYIFTSAGWEYDEILAEKRADDLQKFLYRLFPVPDERRLMLKYCASLLHGHRTEKKFIILTDERGGDNGKSTWVNFLCGFFGDMAYNNTRLFLNTTIQDKNGQDAILFKVHNKRLIIGSEFKDGMKLDVSLMKKLTGMDPITGRHFGKEQEFSFMSQAGVILVYNHGDAPKEDWGDDAYQHRKLLFKMKSKFVKGLKNDDLKTFTFRAVQSPKKREMFSAFLKLLISLNVDWEHVDEKMDEDSSDLHVEIEQFINERVVSGNGFIQLKKLYHESGIRCKSKEFVAIAKNILISRGGKFLNSYSPVINEKQVKYYNVISGFIM